MAQTLTQTHNLDFNCVSPRSLLCLDQGLLRMGAGCGQCVPRTLKRTVSRRKTVSNHKISTYGCAEYKYAARFRFCAKCPRGGSCVPITSSCSGRIPGGTESIECAAPRRTCPDSRSCLEVVLSFEGEDFKGDKSNRVSGKGIGLESTGKLRWRLAAVLQQASTRVSRLTYIPLHAAVHPCSSM
jgi:hypothetical protein